MTFNIITVEGRDAVAAMLADRAAIAKPAQWQTPLPPDLPEIVK